MITFEQVENFLCECIGFMALVWKSPRDPALMTQAQKADSERAAMRKIPKYQAELRKLMTKKQLCSPGPPHAVNSSVPAIPNMAAAGAGEIAITLLPSTELEQIMKQMQTEFRRDRDMAEEASKITSFLLNPARYSSYFMIRYLPALSFLEADIADKFYRIHETIRHQKIH